MAEDEAQALGSAFPNPPSFWRDFTADKITRMEELRRAFAETIPETQSASGDDAQGIIAIEDGAKAEGAGAQGQTEVPVRIPDVPEDLMNLQPPAEPEDGRWRIFGDFYMLNDELPTLEEQGITNLPSTHPSRKTTAAAATTTTTADPTSTAPPSIIPDTKDTSYSDRALELKRLVKSLLLNFLELTGVLSCQPAHADAKIEDIRTLFINIHHALNEYRPHQARESAAEMMQEHLDRTRRETVAIRSQVDKARRVLEGLGSLTVPEGVNAAAAAAAAAALEDTKAEGSGVGLGGEGGWEEMRREREKELWKTTDVAFA